MAAAVVRVVVVPLHHDVAAHRDLAEGLAVVQDLVALIVDDPQLPEVISSTPWQALTVARSDGERLACPGAARRR